MLGSQAASAGVTVGQVRHLLNKLLQFRLVDHVAHGQWIGYPATEEQLDTRVARPTGKLGKGEQRKRLFEAERAIQIGRRIMKAIETQVNKQNKPTPETDEEGQWQKFLEQDLSLGADIQSISVALDNIKTKKLA